MPLPAQCTEEKAQTLIAALLGKAIQKSPAEAAQLLSSAPLAVASYGDDSGSTQAWAVCDLDFAANAAMALILAAPNRAEELTKAGRFDEQILENLGEIFNVLAQLFAQSDGSQWKLLGVEAEAAPGSKQASWCFHADIAGYGGGRIAVFLAE
ncbi:MAG: hypothetical protein AAF430_21915 [Myxococcota bacterium]